MITQVRFQNFKALKSAELKLGAFNVIVGPNGSGKSSVLQGLEALAEPHRVDFQKAVTVGMAQQEIRISIPLKQDGANKQAGLSVQPGNLNTYFWGDSNNEVHVKANEPSQLLKKGPDILSLFQRINVYSLEASSMWRPVDSRNWTVLNREGTNLAGALTHLRDKDDDAFNHLLDEFRRWIPEYQSIGF